MNWKLIAAERLAKSLNKKLNTDEQEKAHDIEFLLRRLRVLSMSTKRNDVKCGSYYK